MPPPRQAVHRRTKLDRARFCFATIFAMICVGGLLYVVAIFISIYLWGI